MPSHDVVIVGAAPAGSLAALVLARAGHRVALLDRAYFPRPKVCGNCINPSAWKIWRQLGLTDAFSSLPHQELTGFAVHIEGRLIYEYDFRPPNRGPRAVSRDILDDWLRVEAQKAGAEFLPGTTVPDRRRQRHRPDLARRFIRPTRPRRGWPQLPRRAPERTHAAPAPLSSHRVEDFLPRPCQPR